MSLLSRAQSAELIEFDHVNLRECGEGKYRAVDDKPYGGGAGMVMMPTVLEASLVKLLGSEDTLAALEKSVRDFKQSKGGEQSSLDPNSKDVACEPRPTQAIPHVIFLSPQGRRLDAALARQLAQKQHLVLLCGHYEGVDERAIEAFVHEEVSIGDFILTGGEPAALVLIDAMARFVPGVVGDPTSVAEDTFEGAKGNEMVPGGLKYPVFTRPPVWRGRSIPDVLVSGHHREIAKWRREQSRARTESRRPDLLRLEAVSDSTKTAPLKSSSPIQKK